MNTVQKVERAADIIRERTGEPVSYLTDDNGHVTQMFLWRAHGLKIHGPFSSEPLKEIVRRLENLVKLGQ